MYNSKSLFVDNPINRYSICTYTTRDQSDDDTNDSLDIYIPHASPRNTIESNWLSSDTFHLILRMYLPTEEVLNGTWTPPPIRQQ